MGVIEGTRPRKCCRPVTHFFARSRCFSLLTVLAIRAYKNADTASMVYIECWMLLLHAWDVVLIVPNAWENQGHTVHP